MLERNLKTKAKAPASKSSAASNWKAVWEAKKESMSADGGSANILATLIRLNGFDTGCGDYSMAQWGTLAAGVARRARLGPQSRVFEVGCGSGAFLYELRSQTDCHVSGTDYSASLVAIAEKYVPGDFIVAEASSLPVDDEQFDLVFAHSVFQYFPDWNYAVTALSEMKRILKPGGCLCLLDINDKSFEEVYHSLRRKLYEDAEEYDRKYKDFPHAFYERDMVAQQLRDMGLEQVQFFPHDVTNYVNSDIRFNVFAIK